MGAGKSTIGRHLAHITGFDFIDLDIYIEKKRGCSIPEIFEKEGEQAFRKEEFDSLSEIIGNNNTPGIILALGGGTVTQDACARIVKSSTRCIYIKTPKEQLVKRLQTRTANRPLLKNKSKRELELQIEQLMKQREPIYEECAHIIIENNGSIKEIIDKILEVI